jgi:hypothetical protein
MTYEQVKKFLVEEFPWFLTEASISMLRTANDFDDLRSMTIRLGRDGRLPINAEYEAAVGEYFSIYIDADDHGEATRQQIYRDKKRKDETAELVKLRAELKDIRIVNVQGERLDVNTLSLPALRQHKADIENHIRMKGMSAGDLRAENAAKYPAPVRRADGFPQMPKVMCLPAGLRIGDRLSDGIHTVEMTPELIHAFSRAKSDSAEWHFYRFRLCRAYGPGQVTERQQVSIPTGVGE